MKLSNTAIGSLFTIPQKYWLTIAYRVGATVIVNNNNGSKSVTTILKTFPKLVSACQTWNQDIYPGLTRYSTQLNQFADKTVKHLRQLDDIVSGLDQSKPIPKNSAELIKIIFGQMYAATQNMETDISNIQSKLNSFFVTNSAIDTAMNDFQSKVGASVEKLGSKSPYFEYLFMQVCGTFNNMLGTAMGLDRGAWQAINADLQDVRNNKIAISMPFLLTLDIKTAITDWQNITKEASSFLSDASDITPYSSGNKLSKEDIFPVSNPASIVENYTGFLALQTEH